MRQIDTLPENNQIKTSLGDINYYVYGSGPKIMLCFHGFGQDGLAMIPIAKAQAQEYTSYCFDLFYHGKTYWNSNEEPIKKSFWIDTLKRFLIEKNITSFSITAFSLGGKIALVTTEYFAPQIDQLILLAPDGIKTGTWYNLATYPSIFRKYFKSIIVKPQRFHRVVNTLNRASVLDKGIKKFAYSQMNTVRQRRRVYYSWVAFKNLSTDLTALSKLINDNGIEVTMYLGVYDKIITQDGVSIFMDGVENISLNILNTGHNNLIGHVAKNMDAQS